MAFQSLKNELFVRLMMVMWMCNGRDTDYGDEPDIWFVDGNGRVFAFYVNTIIF